MIEIIYSPGWNRWNLIGHSGPLQHLPCESNGPAGKEDALRRLTLYVQGVCPGIQLERVSDDCYREALPKEQRPPATYRLQASRPGNPLPPTVEVSDEFPELGEEDGWT